MQSSLDHINLTLKIGSHVRAREQFDSSEWREASILEMAPWGVFVQEQRTDGQEGLVFAAIWANVEIIPDWLTDSHEPFRAEASLQNFCSEPGFNMPVRVGQTVEAQVEPGSGVWDEVEVLEVHPTHLVVNYEDSDKISRETVGWDMVKLYAITAAEAIKAASAYPTTAS